MFIVSREFHSLSFLVFSMMMQINFSYQACFQNSHSSSILKWIMTSHNSSFTHCTGMILTLHDLWHWSCDFELEILVILSVCRGLCCFCLQNWYTCCLHGMGCIGIFLWHCDLWLRALTSILKFVWHLLCTWYWGWFTSCHWIIRFYYLSSRGDTHSAYFWNFIDLC